MQGGKPCKENRVQGGEPCKENRVQGGSPAKRTGCRVGALQGTLGCRAGGHAKSIKTGGSKAHKMFQEIILRIWKEISVIY